MIKRYFCVASLSLLWLRRSALIMANNKDDKLSRFQIIFFFGGREGGWESSEFYDLRECKRFDRRKMNF